MVCLAPPGMYGIGDGKPDTGDGEPEPGTHDQGAPGLRMAGPGTVRLLATTWTVSLAPETASLACTHDCCMYSVRVYMRGY